MRRGPTTRFSCTLSYVACHESDCPFPLAMTGSPAGGAVTRYRMPVVYLNDRLYGTDLNLLREFGPNNVNEVGYLSPSEAQSRWGTGLLGGVIQLVTERRSP